MELKRIALYLCLLTAVFYCFSAQAKDLRIAAASDIHVQKVDQNTISTNPLTYHHLEIIDALLADAIRNEADLLLLLGDSTNQGRLNQHEMLLEKLRSAKEQGLRILILPGNHDIGEVTTTQFPELYEEFGYGSAFSRDEFSMSYSVLIEDQLILMLDTNGYETNRFTACLSPETLKWMERQLIAAKDHGWSVLAAGHYPLLTEHSTEFIGREDAVRLFLKYNVPLYLCGHLHGRSTAVHKGLTELVVEQSVSYPCCYALFQRSDKDSYRYAPRRIDVTGWAAISGRKDPYLLAFPEFSESLARERYMQIVDQLKGYPDASAEGIRLAKEFFWQTIDAMAQGVLHEKAETLKEHPGYPLFLKMAGTSIYARWLPSVLDRTNPYSSGFVIENGKLVRK